jgi:hypothetical protein
MTALEKRLTNLEKQVRSLTKLVKSGVVTKEEDQWLKLADAAYVLNLSPDTLRRKIKAAKNGEAPYQKGIHWDGERTYRINVTRWHTAI